MINTLDKYFNNASCQEGYEVSYEIFEQIYEKGEHLINYKNNYSQCLALNAQNILQLIEKLTICFVAPQDKEPSLFHNWKEDREPLTIKFDSKQIKRVPIKPRLQEEEGNFIKPDKEKIIIDVNNLLINEIEAKRKKLLKEYIKKHSKINITLKGTNNHISPLRSRDNSFSSIGVDKPWELCAANYKTDIPFNANSPKFFVRKIIANQVINKKAFQENSHQKELKDFFMSEKIQQTQIEDENKIFQLTSCLEKEVKEEEVKKIQNAYFKIVSQASPKRDIKPFNFLQAFPKVQMPILVQAPKQIVKTKFELSEQDKIIKQIDKKIVPTKFDMAIKKKIEETKKARSNSPINRISSIRQIQSKDDSIKQIIYNSKSNEKSEILPEIDLFQMTRINNQKK